MTGDLRITNCSEKDLKDIMESFENDEEYSDMFDSDYFPSDSEDDDSSSDYDPEKDMSDDDTESEDYDMSEDDEESTDEESDLEEEGYTLPIDFKFSDYEIEDKGKIIPERQFKKARLEY